MLLIIRKLLKQVGFADPEEAGDAAALAKLTEARFDLVLAGRKELVSGFEPLDRMRQDLEIGPVPLIMIPDEGAPTGEIVQPLNTQTLKARLDAALCA